ncbi:hypothetical protein LQ424_30665 [Rhodococcus qingshengii]|uniref:hypothetical protein n=1 Tax=Rhodococcus TaxID=1827 RepID=UPI001E6137E6|nr:MULTISPECIES: hypothetical protein [Rhodococcus]MCD2136191.1 hypothetical protein [Rhodococcus qingshengii]
MLLQERFGYYDPTFELARIAVEQHHGVLWWKNDADQLRAQLVTPEFHGSWLAGAILVAADAADVGTKPGRRYLAGDREPRCSEDRAWLGLFDDVVAMQRFRLERESGLAVTWIQDFVPAGQLEAAGLSGDEANLFAAGVALIRQAQIRCNADSVGNDGILWGAILICGAMQDFLIGNGHGTSTMWRFCGAFRRPTITGRRRPGSRIGSVIIQARMRGSHA